MKRIMMMIAVAISCVSAKGQVMSLLPIGPTVTDSVYLSGVLHGSRFTTYRWSMRQLATYIGATGGSDSLSSVLARGYWGGNGGILLGKRSNAVKAVVCLNNYPVSRVSQAGSLTLFDSSFNKHIHISPDSFFSDVPISAPHIGGWGGTPTIAAGAGAGSSPTVTVSATASDLSGYIEVTPGSSPGTGAVVFTVTFATAFGTKPIVLLTPANSAAKLLSVGAQIFVDASSDVSTTTWAAESGGTALTASTLYRWNYVVIGTR